MVEGRGIVGLSHKTTRHQIRVSVLEYHAHASTQAQVLTCVLVTTNDQPA